MKCNVSMTVQMVNFVKTTDTLVTPRCKHYTIPISITSVSYTHLDVYKRQILGLCLVIHIWSKLSYNSMFLLPHSSRSSLLTYILLSINEAPTEPKFFNIADVQKLFHALTCKIPSSAALWFTYLPATRLTL